MPGLGHPLGMLAAAAVSIEAGLVSVSACCIIEPANHHQLLHCGPVADKHLQKALPGRAS